MSNDVKNDNLVLVVKINRTYREDMSAEELYESVRGIWRLDKSKRNLVQYVFGVFHGKIVAIYEVLKWDDAGTIPYKFRTHLPETLTGRSEFVGRSVSDEMRSKYMGKKIKLTAQTVNYYPIDRFELEN